MSLVRHVVMSAGIKLMFALFSSAFCLQIFNISSDVSRPVIFAFGLCCSRHIETPPLPIPTSSTVLMFVTGAKAASHTASLVGLYLLWCIFTRPPSRVKISCFMLIAIYNNSIKSKGKYMLDDVVIVQSAISAFNNAALWAPAFLWWAVLALPLFAVIYLCADSISGCVGWNRQNIVEKSAPWIVGLLVFWVVLLGGNYSVLRDGATVLPFVNATILFLGSAFLSGKVRFGALPHIGLIGKIAIVLFVLVMVVLSDVHIWWGPLLQLGAMVIGWLIGRLVGARFGNVSFVCVLMIMAVSAVLMQPEFFRFGQLGNLTVIHLFAVLVFAMFCVAALVVTNVRARHKIKSTVYVKLKWLLRTFVVLTGAFFILTEALPVFFAVLGFLCLLFIVSVKHLRSVSPAFGRQLFALGVFLFGVIMVMPAVCAVGILIWDKCYALDFWRDFKALL